MVLPDNTQETPTTIPEAISAPADSAPAAISTPEVTPVAAPAAVPEISNTVAPAQNADAPIEASTILGTEVKLPDAAPEPVDATQTDTNVTTEETPVETQTEGDQTEQTAPLPTYEDFAVPENVNLNEEEFGSFKTKLGEFELKSKADHAAVQEFGQAILNDYFGGMQKALGDLQQQYKQALEDTKAKWLNDFEKDPEIGGNRRDTTVNAAREFIETHGGTAEQKNELRQALQVSGLGNHPALIRLMAKASVALSEGSLLAANKAVPVKKGIVETMYGKM